MLKVKDVSRLKVYGYEEMDGIKYKKGLENGSEISVDGSTGEISVCTFDDDSQMPEELYELYAANLVVRV